MARVKGLFVVSRCKSDSICLVPVKRCKRKRDCCCVCPLFIKRCREVRGWISPAAATFSLYSQTWVGGTVWTETRRSCGTRRRRKREVVVVVDDDDVVDDIPQGHKLFHLTHTHNPPKALLIVLNREFEPPYVRFGLQKSALRVSFVLQQRDRLQ